MVQTTLHHFPITNPPPTVRSCCPCIEPTSSLSPLLKPPSWEKPHIPLLRLIPEPHATSTTTSALLPFTQLLEELSPCHGSCSSHPSSSGSTVARSSVTRLPPARDHNLCSASKGWLSSLSSTHPFPILLLDPSPLPWGRPLPQCSCGNPSSACALPTFSLCSDLLLSWKPTPKHLQLNMVEAKISIFAPKHLTLLLPSLYMVPPST